MNYDKERNLFYSNERLVCGHYRTPDISGGSGWTGAAGWGGLTVCADCWNALTRLEMAESDVKDYAGYLDEKMEYVVAIDNGKLAKVTHKATYKRPHSWVSLTYTYFRCIDTHGQEWYGGGYGEMMSCWLKKRKDFWSDYKLNLNTGLLEDRPRYNSTRHKIGDRVFVNCEREEAANITRTLEEAEDVKKGYRNWFGDILNPDGADEHFGKDWGIFWHHGTYDDLVNVSNWHVVKEEMAPFPKDAESYSYQWAARVVWIDRWGNHRLTAVGRKVAELMHQYEQYCVLDEDDLSKREMDQQWELVCDELRGFSLVNYPTKEITDENGNAVIVEDVEKLASEVFEWMSGQSNNPGPNGHYRNFRTMETGGDYWPDEKELKEAVEALGYIETDLLIGYVEIVDSVFDDYRFYCTNHEEDECDDYEIAVGDWAEGSVTLYNVPGYGQYKLSLISSNFITCHTCAKILDRGEYKWKSRRTSDPRQPMLIPEPEEDNSNVGG